MESYTRDLLAFGAAFAALAGIGYAIDNQDNAPRAARWQLVEEYKGNSFVLDHGMSLDDCAAAMPRNDVARGMFFACEREG